MKGNNIFIIMAILVGAYLIYTFWIKSASPDAGEMAPCFEEESISGQMISLEELRGKYVILDFWASWCPPCRIELPHLIELQENNTDSQYEIVSIALEKNASNAAIVAEKLGINWPRQIVRNSAFVSTDELARMYGVTDIPASFLIDPKGKLIGQMTASEIKQYLKTEATTID